MRSGDGDPDVLQLTEVPVPELQPTEVLIRVRAAGLNRADVMQRRGLYPPPPGVSDILGLEVSGEIAASGPEVTGWSIGEPCVALLAGGGYAEYVAAPAGQVLPSPPGVEPVTAAGVVEVAATVVSNALTAGLRPGDTYLVHGGAGGIGSFAIGYAKALGCTVWTTAGSEEKLAFCRELGADLAVSYLQDWAAAFTEAGGADVILDNQGARSLAANLRVLKPDGRLVIIGLQGGRKAEIDLNQVLQKRNHVIATSLRSRPPEQKAEICRVLTEQVWPLYAEGRLPAPLTKVFEAADVVAAHTYFDSGEHRGKIVLTF